MKRSGEHDSEDFSRKDMRYRNSQGVNGYLVTPFGKFLFYRNGAVGSTDLGRL